MSPLHAAVESQSFQTVCTLVQGGICLNTVENINGWTPLHLASFNGLYQICEHLISYGADKNIKDFKIYNF